jgi:hypothetical protein
VENITNPMCTAASAWAPLTVSPIAPVQGSGLPFAGYVATDAAVTQLNGKARHTVPDPRGRQR